MTDSDVPDLTEAWNRAADALPAGWRLDGLRCASTGLTPDLRSEDWVAAALGPNGEEQTFRATDPVAALLGIVEALTA